MLTEMSDVVSAIELSTKKEKTRKILGCVWRSARWIESLYDWILKWLNKQTNKDFGQLKWNLEKDKI